LRSLHISETYVGLLEGTPNDEINRMILKGVPARYQHVFGKHPVYVLPPVIERWEEPHPAGRFGKRIIAVMPHIEVAALFESIDSTGQPSALIIAWHQNAVSLTLSDDIQHRLTTIDWPSHAHDFEY
jgi:hypothetical protein